MQNINLYKQPNQRICLFATPWRGELSMIESHILHHPNGQVYLGRVSGFGTPYQVMMRRYYHHNKWRAFGFGKPTLDKYAFGVSGRYAIRGREQQFIQVLVAYEKCDFRGIKCAFNDVNDAAFDLDSKQYKELNHILYLKFGISLDNQNKKVIKKIKTILKRGRIENVDEYRLVSERVERICAPDFNSGFSYDGIPSRHLFD